MDLRVSLVDLSLADVLDVALSNPIDVLYLLNEAFAKIVDESALLFDALVENVALLLLFIFLYGKLSQNLLLFLSCLYII